MSNRPPRFPDIDWYCDRCNAHLNVQANFNDHHYVWKCTKCGFKSSISRTNITNSPSKGVNVLGKILGALRTLSIYLCIAILLNILVFKAELVIPSWVLPIAGIAYLVLDIFSMVFEKIIDKYSSGQKLPIWILSSFFIYLGGDLWRILYEPFHMIKTTISFFFSKKKWIFNLIETIILGLVYTVLLVAFIMIVVCLSKNATPNPIFDKVNGWISTFSNWVTGK